MKDIATRCGVGQATVSRVLNDSQTVDREKAALIRAVAKEMGYDFASQQHARRLVQRRFGHQSLSQLVAIFSPINFQNGNYYPPIVEGIIDVTSKMNYGVCIGSFEWKVGTDRFPLQPVISRGDVDGLIVMLGNVFSQEDIANIRNTPGFGSRPIISVGDVLTDASAVICDQEQIVSLYLHHLLQLGHRHILHLSYHDEVGGRKWERIQYARRIMADAGLSPDRYLHVLPIPYEPNWGDADFLKQLDPSFNMHGAFLVDYLRAHPEVTALVGVNDACAIYAWYTLRQAGYRVPDDISIVGVDDTTPMLDRSGQNMLTTVRVPLTELGRTGARLLLQRISQEIDQDTRIVLPAELIDRSSTAPPPSTPRLT